MKDVLATSIHAWPRIESLTRSSDAAARELSPLEVMLQMISDYGDYVPYCTLYGNFVLVNDAELIRDAVNNCDLIRNRLLTTVLGDGLLSSNGEHWERQRRLMLPVFQPRQIARMVETFRHVTDERIAEWLTERGGEARDLTRDIYRIALSNVGRVLFATDFSPSFLDALDIIMREISAIQNATTFGFPLIRRVGGQDEYRKATDTIESAVEPLVSRCRGRQAPSGPLLDALVGKNPGRHHRPLSDKQIRNEILTMIIAGHETTAVALCWALRTIATHPHVAKRLYEEVDTVIGTRPIQAQDVARLHYTRALIDETLRLYPPVWLVARTAAKDTQLGRTPISEGTAVLVSPFALHRHHEYWSNPLQFDPERFSNRSTRPLPYTYLPFLAGRHQCLGKYFALTEMVVVIASIAQRLQLHLVDETPLEFEPLVSLRIRGGVKLNVEARVHGRVPC